jgi:DivIVA domain-containing protein
VTITAADIKAVQFPLAFRGYNVQVVDAFLDQLQADLTEALADHADEPATPDPAYAVNLDQTPMPDHDPSSSADADSPTTSETGPAAQALRVLQRAEQTAEQVIADAAAEAAELRGRAHAEAETIIASARAESGRIDAELHQRREHEIGALLVQKQRLRDEIDRLSGLQREYHDALSALLSEQLRLLERHTPVLDTAAATTPTSGDHVRSVA